MTRIANGFGAGAYTTSLALYSQSYFWINNGRILRARLNLSYSTSDRVKLEGLSVYGTMVGFVGGVRPGDTLIADLAFEYGATGHWVVATDFWYERGDATHLFGGYSANATESVIPVPSSSDVTRVIYVAPALEYNWNRRVGIIFGTRVVANGRNVLSTVTPAVALNWLL